jgi:hypothetical protein
MSRLVALAVLASSLVAAGCLAEPEDDADLEIGEAALAQKADEHWLYTGPMPVLEAAKVFVSLQGHTARVSGLLPAGARVPDLPHVKAQAEGARPRLDVEAASPGRTTCSPSTRVVTWSARTRSAISPD